MVLYTFSEQSNRLAVWKDAFHVDANRAPRRVLSSNDCESKARSTRAFLESDILEAEHRLAAPSLAGQGAKFGALHNLGDKVVLIGESN